MLGSRPSGAGLVLLYNVRRTNERRSTRRAELTALPVQLYMCMGSPLIWYVACTKPNAERYAFDALTAPCRQCTVYYPRVRATVTHAGRRVDTTRPFLPRYIFVQDDGRGVAHIRKAPGISSLPQVGSNFMSVRQSIIDQMMAREVLGLIQLDGATAARGFERGRPIVVTSGPLQWRQGIFDHKLSGDQRAVVFFDIFGSSKGIEIDMNRLELA